MTPARQMRPKPLVLLASVLCFGPTGASAQIIEYAHLDAVGNVRAVTDQNGVVIERHDYLPFGEECLTGPCASNPNAGAGQPRKFTGKERDTETGLDYFGARYYRANIGRFTTIDPVYTWRENLVDPQRWNRYAYVRNNPLRYVDPDGRQMAPQPGTLDSIIDYFNRTVGLNYQPAVVMQEGERPRVVGMPDKETVAKAMIVAGAAAVVADLAKGDAPRKDVQPLPGRDITGKVHGPLPEAGDLGKYSVDELRQFQGELKQSVQERIRRTVALGPDKGHGERQATEQTLIRQIEKHLDERR